VQTIALVVRSVLAGFRGERGQDLIEYAMLSGLIAAAIVAVGVLLFTGALTKLITGIGNCIDFVAGGCNPGF
jgi:Flp pilus assembly pilin Flp